MMLILYHTHTYIQSYRMHLKSSNGPIDVLVCPEDEDSLDSPLPPSTHPPHPPHPSPAKRLNGSTTTVTTHLPHHHPALNSVTPVKREEFDVSLSSTADVRRDEFDGFFQYSDTDSLDNIEACSLLATTDLCSFEALSPQLGGGEFCFTMDEGEGIGDLFDLVD